MGESSVLVTDANNNLFYLSQSKPPFFYLTESVHNQIAAHQHNSNLYNNTNKRARDDHRHQQLQTNGFPNLFSGDLFTIMHGAQTLQQQTQHIMQQAGNNHALHGGGNAGLPHTVQANTASIADYLAQLIKDKKQLGAFPNVFLHVERILDEGKCILWNYHIYLFVCK